MRPSYLQSVWDRFSPAPNMSRLFQWLIPGKPKEEIETVIRESRTSEAIQLVMKYAASMNGFLSFWKLVFLRSFVRLVRPETVLETGVAHGSSSAVMLEALEFNQKGKLYSIDLPIFESSDGSLKPWLRGYQFKRDDISTVPSESKIGWLVPGCLRGRWELILGDSLEELPKLLARLGSIDLFFHDSLHLYQHMMREFELVWPHLAEGGFILADDIFIRNHAVLHDFAKQYRSTFKNFIEIGVIPKNGEGHFSNVPAVSCEAKT